MSFAPLASFAGILLVASSSAVLSSCGAPAPPAPSGALRGAFPGQAAAVLDQAEALVETRDGFAPAAERGAPRDFTVTLPRAGDGAVRFRMRGGLEVRVRELDAAGEGIAEGRAVAYRRAGGTSFWTVAPGGVEHWLHLAGGAPRAGAVAAWDVEGATLRLHGEAVAVMDGTGEARLWVTSPRAYAGGGRAVTARLGVRGARLELFVGGVADGEPVLVDPAWTTTAPLNQARDSHTATLLADGSVLVAGGEDPAQAPLSSAERYDPVANVWTLIGPMASARAFHTATLLGSGKVLIAGGTDGSGLVVGAELFDLQTSAFTAAGAMAIARERHTATLLGGGKVLIVGGTTSVPLLNAELYDPQTGAFQLAGALGAARQLHTATLLGNGDVLVAGGIDPVSVGTLAGAELYDPQTDAFTPTGALLAARASHAATLLPSGDVLVAGGAKLGSVPLASVERFDVQLGTWTGAAPLAAARLGPTATLLPNGLVLVAGGLGAGNSALAGAELYAPVAGAWQLAPSLFFPRFGHAATLLAGGSVLVTGGVDARTEIFGQAPAVAGASCAGASDCASGVCSDGVCCGTACGQCHTCSVAHGAVTQGVCAPTSLGACDDGDACTTVDQCNAGVCQGKAPVQCPAQDACHAAGVCAPATGLCTNPTKPDGTVCDDADACTKMDTCQAGACHGSPVVCTPTDACVVAGVCDPTTGHCPQAPRPDGTACDDGSACTQMDQCRAGVCAGVSAVVCTPLDACHENGACDPVTAKCTNPTKPDGQPCPGGACAQGACVPTLADGGTGGSRGMGAGSSGSGGGARSGGCSVQRSEPVDLGGSWRLGLALLFAARLRRSSRPRTSPDVSRA